MSFCISQISQKYKPPFWF